MKMVVVALALASFGCGAAPRRDLPPAPAPAASCVPAPGASAPTYGELYARYFASGTPGHCAKSHCHGSIGANAWVCGDSPESCYRGMLKAGLIDAKNPKASGLADPNASPLAWVNGSGDMPLGAVRPWPEARDAIVAWVAACAPND
jgi:hypothetical protein